MATKPLTGWPDCRTFENEARRHHPATLPRPATLATIPGIVRLGFREGVEMYGEIGLHVRVIELRRESFAHVEAHPAWRVGRPAWGELSHYLWNNHPSSILAGVPYLRTGCSYPITQTVRPTRDRLTLAEEPAKGGTNH